MLFCEKPPKGFEKYFKQSSKDAPKDVKQAESKEAQGSHGKDAKTEPKSETLKPRSAPASSGQSGKSKPYDQWSFGLFGGTGSRLVSLP